MRKARNWVFKSNLSQPREERRGKLVQVHGAGKAAWGWRWLQQAEYSHHVGSSMSFSSWQSWWLGENLWLRLLCGSEAGSSPWLVNVYADETWYVNQSGNCHWVVSFAQMCAGCSVRPIWQIHQHLKITPTSCFLRAPEELPHVFFLSSSAAFSSSFFFKGLQIPSVCTVGWALRGGIWSRMEGREEIRLWNTKRS